MSAHRRQVEKTIDIVREVSNDLFSVSFIFLMCCERVMNTVLCADVQEMNLLVEADQPGNQLYDYISKLNAILSQKATEILQLQNQLAQFQRHLNEHNVLVSSGN